MYFFLHARSLSRYRIGFFHFEFAYGNHPNLARRKFAIKHARVIMSSWIAQTKRNEKNKFPSSVFNINSPGDFLPKSAQK